MKDILFAAALALASAAQAQVSIEWVNQPGGVGIAVDAAENVYTARWDYNPAGDIYLAKRNAAGALQWEVRYDNTDSTRHEVATWVATDSAGNAIVTGTLRSGYSNPVNANSIIMKFDPGGRLLWRRVYDGFFDGSSTRKALVDPSDNIYVLGLGTGPAGQVTTVRKFAPDGATLWAWFDSAGIGAPQNFKFTPDGAIVISARGITGSINGYAKIDRNGGTIWSQSLVYSLTIGDAAGDAQGNTYLINGVYTSGGGSVLRKVSPGGATLWERTHPMSGFRVEVGGDNAPVVSGFPSSGTSGAAFMKHDGNGNLMWTNLDADGPALALLSHAQMRLDRANNAYLAAGTMSAMGVVRVNSDGTSAWASTVPFGYSQAMELGDSGAVYVAGGSTAKLAQRAGASTDLMLTMTSAQTTVAPGGTVSYTAVARNLGPAAASGVQINGTLPPCFIGPLAVGASATCSWSITAPATGTITQTMSVGSAAADPVQENNSASVSTQVVAPVGADLQLTVTDEPDPVVINRTLTYTATVTNLGPAIAPAVRLSQTLPSSLVLISAIAQDGTCSGTRTIACTLGVFASGESRIVTISARPTRQGSVSSNASVTADSADPNSDNNAVSVVSTVRRR